MLPPNSIATSRYCQQHITVEQALLFSAQNGLPLSGLVLSDFILNGLTWSVLMTNGLILSGHIVQTHT